MRTSTTRAKKVRATVGTIAMALTFGTMIGGISDISMGPALADEHDRRQGEQNRGGHERERHDQRDRRQYQQPYGYYAAPPVIYAPPPVYYAPPPPSPGISLFFPLRFR